MSWHALVVLSAVVYAMKAAGPLLAGRRRWLRPSEPVAGLAVPTLIAVAATATVTQGKVVSLDARAVGVAVAVVLAARRTSMPIVVVAAAVGTSLTRVLAA